MGKPATTDNGPEPSANDLSPEPPPDKPKADLSLDLSTAEYNLSLIAGWIRFADGKATFLLTVAIAAFSASLSVLPSTTRVVIFCLDDGRVSLAIILAVLTALFYCTLAVALYLLVDVVRPRLDRDSGKHSWYYFQSMASLNSDQFRDYTDGLTIHSKMNQLHDQIYNNTRIATKKFERVRCAVIALSVAMILGTLAIIPALVVDTILS
jgi:hypothetical protein